MHESRKNAAGLKDTMYRQYSLRNIFLIGGIIFTLAFCIISAISTINIIKAEKTIESHSRLENQIFFPLTRAIEEIYNSLADLQAQFTRRQAKFTVEQFKWNIESSMANLTQAQQAIQKLLTRNTDIITAVSETRRATLMFQQSGIRALKQTDILYDSMAQCDKKINEIFQWTTRFFNIIEKNPHDKNLSGTQNHQKAIRALTDVKLTYLKLCSKFYKKVIFFHELRPEENLDELWNRLFTDLQRFSTQYPELAGRVLFLQEELKTLKVLTKTVFSAAIAAASSIKNANALADELGINLELCRQAIAATNIEIQGETRRLRMTMAMSLGTVVLFYMFAALLTARWLRKNILTPLNTFTSVIEKIGDGDQQMTVQLPALKELSSIAEKFNLMTTRLKEREQGLEKARQKWETVFKAIGGPAMVLSTDCRIMEYNEVLRDIIEAESPDGETGKDFRGRKCFEIMPCKNDQATDCPIHAMAMGKNGQAYSMEKEIGGKPHLVTLSPNINRHGNVESIVIVAADLSLQKKLEEQLRKAQKMEVIGTLAGGVAHDLNNILAGIVTYPDIMLIQLPEDSPLRKTLISIKKSGLKATAVVQDILTLARRGVGSKTILNINNIINDYLESPELKKILDSSPGVKVEAKLLPDIMNIEGSSVHISKTVMNLVTNAAEAMPHGGTITISTTKTYLDIPIPGYDEVSEGDYICITISDNGTGIQEQDLPHIFEPFYTRKVMGRSGSGLGMAVVWGSVQDHAGYIDIKSQEGEGTEIKVYLPATRSTATAKKHTVPISELGGTESILVVDDVEEQREIARYLLESLGYQVDTASNGEEALVMTDHKNYDIILFDMIMEPGMDGLETYRRILEKKPDQKAVIASGFSETEHVREMQRMGAGSYVKKPYTMENLALAVRQEIDRKTKE